jgi:hypothetical protein
LADSESRPGTLRCRTSAAPGHAGERSGIDVQLTVFLHHANMSFAVRLSRVALTAIALVLGSLGIFCLYGSCIGAPLAADAIVCLASATAIVLACPATDAR